MPEDTTSQVDGVWNVAIYDSQSSAVKKTDEISWTPLRCGCGAICSALTGSTRRQMYGSDNRLVCLKTKDRN